MQTLLNTHSFALSHLRERILARASYGLLAILTLLTLIGFTSQVKAASFVKNSVTFASNGGTGGGQNTVSGTYYTNVPGSPGPKFTDNVTSLGTFDRGTGVLNLGAASTTMESNASGSSAENVISTQLFYRVYQVIPGTNTPVTSKPDPSPLVLLQQNSTSDGTSTIKNWQSTSTANIINATPGAGSYILEFFFQYTNTIGGDNTNTTSQNDDNNSNFYSASFTIVGTRPLTWTGAGGSSLSNPDNWSPRATPNFTTDVTIPYTDANGVPLMNFPEVTTNQRIQVRTLTLVPDADASSPETATLTITDGELQIFGDFKDPKAGLTQNGGLFTLAGGNQTFDGGTFTDIKIQGQGAKTLSTRMDVSSSLTFDSSTGNNLLITRTENSNGYAVDLGVDAVVKGETENSFVLGYLRAVSRTVSRNNRNDFGGIGVSLTTTSGASFTTIATRYTGYAYRSATNRSASVKRSFTFIPSTNAVAFSFIVAIHYLNTELNGNTAANLNVFSSPSNRSNFTSIGKTSYDATNQIVTAQTNSTLSTTFILAEPVTPLPVTLLTFTATPTAQGAALLRWATATESNNRGFGIERQLGANDAWQSVGFVAAGATTGSTYEFTDKSLINAPASAQAYYRLRQEDLDAKVTYSPVVVINRQAAVAGTELTLSPVPVSGDNLSVGLSEAGQAGIAVAVINTQGQRVLNFTTQASTDAAISLPVTNLAAGVYIVTVQVPGQAVRHARFVKM